MGRARGGRGAEIVGMAQGARMGSVAVPMDSNERLWVLCSSVAAKLLLAAPRQWLLRPYEP